MLGKKNYPRAKSSALLILSLQRYHDTKAHGLPAMRAELLF
jgi:hypothetical protein